MGALHIALELFRSYDVCLFAEAVLSSAERKEETEEGSGGKSWSSAIDFAQSLISVLLQFHPVLLEKRAIW